MNIFPEERTDYRRTWVWAIPFLVLFVIIAGQLLVLFPAKVLGIATRENVETYPTVLILIIGSFAMIALLFTLWIKLFEGRSMASVGLMLGRRSKKIFITGYANGLLMGAAVVCGVFVLGGYALESASADRSLDLVPIVILMFAFILQSGTEEMVFRGWMMGRIAERYGIWAGIIGNSLLFTLVHVEVDSLAGTPPLMLALFTAMTLLFSIFLSLLTIRQKSVIGASAWHAAWNWIFITWFGLPTTGIELGLSPLIADLTPVAGKAEWLTGGTTGPEGSIMTLLVLVIACVVMLRKRRTSDPQSDEPTSDSKIGR